MARFFFVQMTDKSKRKKLETYIENLLATTPYELVACEFGKSGQEWLLRVYIDHNEGVTLKHCTDVTRMILDAVEEEDPVDFEYQIEVSSPGVDRPLVKCADFQRFLSERVHVKLHAPLEGQKQFTGPLIACENDEIVVENEADKRSYRFPIGDIAKATLKPILKFS